ncbi:Uu.00g094780.m01.CDS01 [Anthostomella pinea]|uniref:Uu.00g094780.m01.CDS01 n=1 Tax=Anthostomella pinea TaxID=933095 RepID=A0AAI8VPE7_9PEZI|nr:Uu.00g094780.m01.CDS01 [Anthostomella pinea]
MPDAAQVNRSLGTIRTELEFLTSSGVLSPPQLQSIQAQLPQPNGQPSQCIDPRYAQGQQQFNPSQIAQQAQDPNNPAHPNNPKHHEWAKKLGSKFGNAALWGAGATFGSDMVNDAMNKF